MVEVVDGDTLKFPEGRVRLEGIDAFEHDQRCNGNTPCGERATSFMRLLTRLNKVTCVGQDHDRYGRLLAHCFIAEWKVRGGAILESAVEGEALDGPAPFDLGRIMVRRGWALAYRRYSGEYVADEDFARDHKMGAWSVGFAQTPEQYRHRVQP